MRNVRKRGLTPLLILLSLLLACSDKPASTPVPEGGAPGVAAIEKAAFETARQNAQSLQTALAAYRASGSSTRWPEGSLNYADLSGLLSDYLLPRTEQEAGYAAFSFEGTGGDDYLVTITVGNLGRDTITVTPREVSPSTWPGR